MLCSVIKPSNMKLDLYMPFSIPTLPWESIYMYFLGDLPCFKRVHDYLFVVVDHFNKMYILIPFKKMITR